MDKVAIRIDDNQKYLLINCFTALSLLTKLLLNSFSPICCRYEFSKFKYELILAIKVL